MGGTRGRNDVTCRWDELLYVADGSAYSLYHTLEEGVAVGATRVMDINGDGLDDIAYARAINYTTARWYVRLSTGTGFTSASNTSIETAYNAVSFDGLLSADYDNDGREDLIVQDDEDDWSVHYSDGTVVSNTQVTTVANALSEAHFAADLNGDGFPELLQVDGTTDTWHTRLHESDLPDVVTTITDGLASAVGIEYASLANAGAAYTPGTSATGSAYHQNFNGSHYVVTEEDHDDGIGTTRTFLHSYEAGRIDVSGRGWLSFETHAVEDVNQEIETSTEFFQTWPEAGRPETVEVRAATAGTLIRSVESDFVTKEYTGTPSRWLVLLDETTAHEYDIEASTQTEIRTVVDSYDYEDESTSFADSSTLAAVETRTTTVTDPQTSDEWTTEQELDPQHDTSPYCRALPGLVETTRTLPDSSSETRSVQHSWNTDCTLYTQTDLSATSTADRLITTFTYDAFGNPDVVSQDSVDGSAVDHSSDYGYDSDGQFPTSVTIGGVNLTTQMTWNYVHGKQATVTSPDGLTSESYYDDFGRLIQRAGPAGQTDVTYRECDGCWAAAYDAVFYMRVLGSDGTERSEFLDVLQRTVARSWKLPGGQEGREITEYDDEGRVSRSAVPHLAGATPDWTDYSFDLIGRMLDVDTPANETTAYDYDALDVEITDPEGDATTYAYNAIGQIVDVTDAASAVTAYTYHPFGELHTVTDPESNVTEILYDARGFKATMSDPSFGHEWCYSYTVYGELETQTSPIANTGDNCASTTVQFTYDAAGRIGTRVESEGTTSFSYYTTGTGNIGRTQSITGPGHSIAYTYDPDLGLPAEITETLDGTDVYAFDMSYDEHGRLEVMTYPESTSGYRFAVEQHYDHWGHRALVTDAATGAPFYTLKATDALGRETHAELGNGLHEVRAFDAETLRLQSIKTGTTMGATGIQDLSFAWYADGSLYTRTNHNLGTSGITETLSYDEVKRLETAQVTGQSTVTLSYSDAGRIESKTGLGTYTYNGTDGGPFAVTGVNGASYEYDANGRMTDRDGDTLTWTSYDLPASIEAGSNAATFSYGVNRARYKQVKTGTDASTTYYVGGLLEVEETATETTYRHHVQAAGRTVAIVSRTASGNEVQYLHRDHQGGVVEVTDESGDLVESLAFDAWGLRRDPTDWSALANPFGGSQTTERGYTGHEHLDPVGLIHMNGRVQDPVLGAFLSADPSARSLVC